LPLANACWSRIAELSLTLTAHPQWIKLPLPGTPRTKDGKPNLTAPAPHAADGHPDLTGIWISSHQYTNPNGRGLERYMPPGSKVPVLPGTAKFTQRSPRMETRPIPPNVAFPMAFRTI